MVIITTITTILTKFFLFFIFFIEFCEAIYENKKRISILSLFSLTNIACCQKNYVNSRGNQNFFNLEG